MFNQRTQLKRAVAVLMPLSLLWLFVACVLICGQESAETLDQPFILSSVEITEIEDVPHCEGCPFASFPIATNAERETLKLNLATLSVVPTSILSVASFANRITFASLQRQSFFTEPPLELLPALRI